MVECAHRGQRLIYKDEIVLVWAGKICQLIASGRIGTDDPGQKCLCVLNRTERGKGYIKTNKMLLRILIDKWHASRQKPILTAHSR